MQNFFAYCELQCEECGDVWVTDSKPKNLGKINRKQLSSKTTSHILLSLVDVSDFFFFLLGEGEGGVRGAGKGGVRFLIKFPGGGGGGGFSRRGRGRGAGKVSAAKWGIGRGGGGLNIFFPG